MESSGKKSHPSPTVGVEGSSGSDLQRVADESVNVIDLKKQWETVRKLRENNEKNSDPVKISSESMRFARSNRNLIEFDEISLDPVKTHRIYLKYRRNFGFFLLRTGKFLPKPRNFRRNLGFPLDGSGFPSFEGGGKLKPTHRSQFLVEKTCCQLPK